MCPARPPAGRRAGCAGDAIDDRLVEQLEDPLGRGHRRLQDVELLRHVADRPEEALRVLEERDQRAERQRALACTLPPPYQMISAAASALTASIAG